MSKRFSGFGICSSCGDVEGPWGWYPGKGWLCEKCEERVMDRWISAKDQKPKIFADILFIDTKGEEYRGTFDRLNRFISSNGEHIEDVVSWKEDSDEF